MFNELCMYNGTVLREDSRSLAIVFLRDQMNKTWKYIAKEIGISERRIKYIYGITKQSLSMAKRFPAAQARIEYFNKYCEKIDIREYEDIENSVFHACGLRIIHGGFGDYAALSHSILIAKDQYNNYSFTYDVGLLNQLIIDSMKHLVKMKKKASKVLINIDWRKGE